MSIDWAATGSMLQGVGTMAGVVAVVWGAIHGTEVWRQQKRAERRQQAAERIMIAAYNGRRALKHIRSPMMLGVETGSAEEKVKETQWWKSATPDRQRRIVTLQVIYDRLNRSTDEMNALNDCLPLAKALFSQELEEAVEKLRHQFWIVQVDAESYVDDEGEHDEEFTKQIRRGMYEITPREGEKNEVTDAINQSVVTIERICDPALKMKAN